MPTYTDRDSMLERWANGAETLAQYYEDLYGPPPDPPQLPALTTYDGLLEAIVEATLRAKRNINKISPTYHNTDSAYTKTVPAGAVEHANLDMLGGRTLVWNQLLETTTSITDNGVTGLTISVSDGWITVSGRAETGGTLVVNPSVVSVPANHKMFLQRDGGNFEWGRNGFSYQTADAFIHSHTVAFGCTPRIRIIQGETYDFTTRFNVIDMTLLFGAGNEPSTVDEFKAQFPADWYAHDDGSLLSADVTSVVSKDADNTTIDTYNIPADIQAITGYGWSCPSHYNYVDFEAKKFIQEVGSRAYASGDESDTTVITDGTNTYYPLNPAVETDISSYLTDDTIQVESGGTLTFENSHGDDYRIPVPSTETFWVE